MALGSQPSGLHAGTSNTVTVTITDGDEPDYTIYHDASISGAGGRSTQAETALAAANLLYKTVTVSGTAEVDRLAGVSNSVMPRFFEGDPTETGWVSEPGMSNGGLKWLLGQLGVSGGTPEPEPEPEPELPTFTIYHDPAIAGAADRYGRAEAALVATRIRRPTLYPAELLARPLESITYVTTEITASRFCQPNRVRNRRWRTIRTLQTCDRHVMPPQLLRGVDHRHLGGRIRQPLRTLHRRTVSQPRPLPPGATRTASARRDTIRTPGRSALAAYRPVRESKAYHGSGPPRQCAGTFAIWVRGRPRISGPDFRPAGRDQVRQRGGLRKQAMAGRVAPHGREAAPVGSGRERNQEGPSGNLKHSASAAVCPPEHPPRPRPPPADPGAWETDARYFR